MQLCPPSVLQKEMKQMALAHSSVKKVFCNITNEYKITLSSYIQNTVAMNMNMRLFTPCISLPYLEVIHFLVLTATPVPQLRLQDP